VAEKKKTIITVGIDIEESCLMEEIPRTNGQASTFQRFK
jgi:hypothetical protein